MPQRLRQVAALAISLVATPAVADQECTVAIHVWELQLVQVAADEGSPDLDLEAVAAALGLQATLRGGYRDPARSKDPVRINLVGSGDGTGLSLRLETPP